MRKKWLSFQKARNYARKFHFSIREEWKAWAKTDQRPEDIPSNPADVYADKGWINWADWLGDHRKKLRPYEEARAFARTLHLNSVHEWLTWGATSARPADIPLHPHSSYKTRGWKGWGDWLGTGTIARHKRVYRPYEEARAYIRQFRFKNMREFLKWARSGKRPVDIPSTPKVNYKDKGWISWNDFLGSNNFNTRTAQFLPFSEARQFAHSLKLKTEKEWFEWTKGILRIPGFPEKPKDLPQGPAKVYEKEWQGWSDFLGTNQRAPHPKDFYLPYEEAKTFVHQLQLENIEAWRAWIRGELNPELFPTRPEKIPTSPDRVYQYRGWINWGEWLNTGVSRPRLGRDFLSFKEARKYARNLKLKRQLDWYAWAQSENRPQNIPYKPEEVYRKQGWKGYGDWLGTGRIASQKREFLPYEEARAYIHKLQIASVEKWEEWAKTKERPLNIPTNPQRTYRNRGWKSWTDWFGRKK